MMKKKELFYKYGFIMKPLLGVKNFFCLKKTYRGKHNSISGLNKCLVSKFRINITGSDNKIIIDDISTVDNVNIIIHGSNNVIRIGKRCHLKGCTIFIEDNNNILDVGNHCYIYQNTELALIEGTKLTLGENCLIAPDVTFRTGDSHTIVSVDSNKRINPSMDISIGNHVWIGNKVVILKGCNIADDSIIASGSVVTSRCDSKENTILGGNPAKVIKTGINWEHERR